MANAVLLQICLTSNVKSLFLDQFPLLSGYVLFSFCLYKANINPCAGGWVGKASICILSPLCFWAWCHDFVSMAIKCEWSDNFLLNSADNILRIKCTSYKILGSIMEWKRDFDAK